MTAPSFRRFSELLARRWAEVCESLSGEPAERVNLTWGLGEYPHFDSPRGYGVTFYTEPYNCHMLYAEKILSAPAHRADGVVRHELGHVVDMTFTDSELALWSRLLGVSLPSTPERRADAIAEAVWGEPILYDRDLVQSTVLGTAPRPRHLGL